MLESWSNFRPQELGISGTAAGKPLVQVDFLLFDSEDSQRLEEMLIYLLGKKCFCVLELAITAIWAGSKKVQMFTLDVSTDHSLFFSTCAKTPSKRDKNSTDLLKGSWYTFLLLFNFCV